MLTPMTATDIADIVQYQLQKYQGEGTHHRVPARTVLQASGAGSKQKMLPDREVNEMISMSQMQKVMIYEPEELVLRVQPGIWIQDVQKMLADEKQILPFEPMNYDYLLSGISDLQETPLAVSGTIGGMVATAQTGPRRLMAGGARDHVLGVEVISGRGEIFRSGGRVMKNVTGYDLPKLMTGAFGRLGILSEITLRVLPAPEVSYACLIPATNLTQAIDQMRLAQQSPFEISAAAYLPASGCQKLQIMLEQQGCDASIISETLRKAEGLVIIRLEGKADSVKGRFQALQSLYQKSEAEQVRAIGCLKGHAAALCWSFVRDVRGLGRHAGLSVEDVVWRLSLPPSQTAGFMAALRKRVSDKNQLSYQIDWAGGLLWLSFPMLTMAGQAMIAELMSKIGGRATLIRAPLSVRAQLWQQDILTSAYPRSGGVQALSRRILQQFDPCGLFAPHSEQISGREGA